MSQWRAEGQGLWALEGRESLGEAEEEMSRGMWRLYRDLAKGQGWERLLSEARRVAEEWWEGDELAVAVVFWDGPDEFFQEVQRERGGRPDGLETLLSRAPGVRRLLEEGAIVRQEEVCGGEAQERLFFAVEQGRLLGALCVMGVKGATAESVARFGELFEGPTMQLARARHCRRELTGCQEENRYFREREKRHYLFKDLVCESEAMRRVYDELNERVEDDGPILMTGEGGCGKELMARAVHHLGGRQGGMLIRMGCAEFPEELVDFELFGCVESELTGAVAPRKGIFELAEGGTVFLDEIDRLSPMVQGKLVRVLKEKEVRRIGDAVGRPVDARVIASCHRDLEGLCGRGRFRRDLYELLKPHRMQVPALRERKEDILPLGRLFLERFASRYEAKCRVFDEALREWMVTYQWPGNVRQLQTFVEAAVLMAYDEEEVRREHLSV